MLRIRSMCYVPGLRQFSRVGYLKFSELTGFAGWWVGDSVSSRFARMQVSDFAVGGWWWVQDHGSWLAGWLAGWMHLRARMHENLNISGTSNHRRWWVVSALLALDPSTLPDCPKKQWVGGWARFDTVRTL